MLTACSRRHFLLLTALTLAALPALGETTGEPSAVQESDVEVDYQDGTYFSHVRFAAPVSQATAWEVLTDFDHMADFVPNLESSRIVSRSGNVLQVAQKGKADFGPFSFRFESERRLELKPRQDILAKAISGSAKYMASEMHLRQEGGKTLFDYRTEMIPDRWIPSSLGVNLLRHEMAEQLSAMVREMVRRSSDRNSR